jgi:hypothetical protein
MYFFLYVYWKCTCSASGSNYVIQKPETCLFTKSVRLVMKWKTTDGRNKPVVNNPEGQMMLVILQSLNSRMNVIILITAIIFTSNSTAPSWLCFSFLWHYSPNLGLGLPPWNSPFHFGFLDLRQSVGLIGRVISSSQSLYLYTNTEKHTHTHTHTKHPCHEWYSNPRFQCPSERKQCML